MEEEILTILGSHVGTGYLATVEEMQPRVRPHSFVWHDGAFWTSTYMCSGKVRELEKNQRVELCFLGADRRHLRVSGTARLSGDVEQRKRLLSLNPRIRKHFESEFDEKFAVIIVQPESIRIKSMGFNEYEELLHINDVGE